MSPTNRETAGGLFKWGSKTFLMAVLNATPDSFSGDGIFSDSGLALELGLQFQAHGADIIDVGGESTRPVSIYSGVTRISSSEEIDRVIPVIKTLTKHLKIPISIDTYKADVAMRAIDAGASMINDVWGLKGDCDMTDVAISSGLPVVLMHNQEHTEYEDLVNDVFDELRRMIDKALCAGIKGANIIVDPGIGFGKTVEQNLRLIRNLDRFTHLGHPILVGTSRKSTIGRVLDLPVSDRIEGTAATVALSIARGADIVRVHDVKEMSRVVRMSDAILRGWKEY